MKGRQEELSVTLQRVSVFKNKQPLCSATPLFSIPSVLRVRAPRTIFLGEKNPSLQNMFPPSPTCMLGGPEVGTCFLPGGKGGNRGDTCLTAPPQGLSQLTTARFKSTNYY